MTNEGGTMELDQSLGEQELPEAPQDTPRSASRSLLDGIIDEYDDQLTEHTVTLIIPGRKKRLAARYKVLDAKALENLTGTGDATSVEANMDFIARACTGVLALDQDSGEYVDLTADNGGGVRYDKALAELLGHPEFDTARKVVSFIFRNNAVAIGRHAEKLITWMGDTSAEVEDTVLGK